MRISSQPPERHQPLTQGGQQTSIFNCFNRFKQSVFSLLYCMVHHYSNTPPCSLDGPSLFKHTTTFHSGAHLVGASHLRAETVGSPKIKRWAVGSISLGCQHIYLTSLLIKLNHCQLSFLHTISNFGLGG